MRAALIAAVLALSGSAHASLVRYVDLAQLVRTSPSITVGRVTSVEVKRGQCTFEARVRYRALRSLKGPATSEYQRIFHANNPGCPQGSFTLPACTIDLSERSKSLDKEAIFFSGGPFGPGCEAPEREGEIARILKTPLTTDVLVAGLATCATSDCFYLVELGKLGEAALSPIRAALLAERVDASQQQLLLYALARLRSPRACALFAELARRPATAEHLLLDALAQASCPSLLPHVRRRFAESDPQSYTPFAALAILAKHKDRAAVPLLLPKLFDVAWNDKLLNVVLTLRAIGDARAVGPLCRRLRVGGFAQTTTADAISETVSALGGRCPP